MKITAYLLQGEEFQLISQTPLFVLDVRKRCLWLTIKSTTVEVDVFVGPGIGSHLIVVERIVIDLLVNDRNHGLDFADLKQALMGNKSLTRIIDKSLLDLSKYHEMNQKNNL